MNKVILVLSDALRYDVAVDNITLAGSNRSIRYSSFQNFQQFRRRIVDNNNNVVSTVLPALTVTGGSPSFGALFDTPIVLNSVNPSRLILGGSNGLYESTNQGDTITRVTSAVIPPDGSSSPIAYGGRSGGIDNLDVVYAGANNGNIHIRTTAGGAFTSTDPDVASSDAILDVRLDSDQWQTAFAIDKNQVFTTNTSGAAWADITGNLPVGSVLRSLEFIGAAVDANVLINERIREERAKGRRVIAAVENGYKEASSAIFDANITNIIAAVLMFVFGSGPVRGFAVVLMIGIATSVFTAVTLTRMWVAGWLRRTRPSDIVI